MITKLYISKSRFGFCLVALSFSVLGGSGSRAEALTLSVESDTVRQGEALRVILKDEKAADAGGDASADGAASASGAALPVVRFRNQSYKAFPLSGSADSRAIVGIPADLAPGTYKLSAGSEERNLKVIPGKFGVQVMRLPKGKDNFISSPGEEEAVDRAKGTVSPHQYWQGKFLKPSKARTSSGFGLRRRVNGKLLTDYFHSGLDFAGGTGSPVAACQNGKVIIAKWGWRLHGNTICIDHGQGVVSFYIHLSKILVKEGDAVQAGQKIGLIGSTGRASGPHLHFSIYANKVATNPWNWFTKEY